MRVSLLPDRSSVDAIAARAEVSKRTVHDYFGDKQTLLKATRRRGSADVPPGIPDHVAPGQHEAPTGSTEPGKRRLNDLPTCRCTAVAQLDNDVRAPAAGVVRTGR